MSKTPSKKQLAKLLIGQVTSLEGRVSNIEGEVVFLSGSLRKVSDIVVGALWAFVEDGSPESYVKKTRAVVDFFALMSSVHVLNQELNLGRSLLDGLRVPADMPSLVLTEKEGSPFVGFVNDEGKLSVVVDAARLAEVMEEGAAVLSLPKADLVDISAKQVKAAYEAILYGDLSLGDEDVEKLGSFVELVGRAVEEELDRLSKEEDKEAPIEVVQ